MSVKSGFFNAKLVSGDYDRKYSADDMAEMFDGMISDGVYRNVGDSFYQSANDGLNVLVSSGKAWFDGIWIYNDSNLSLTFDSSGVSTSRIDAICIKIDKTLEERKGDIVIFKGEPSQTPSRPTFPISANVFYHPIAYVYINAGSSTIRQSDISNLVGTIDCPYVYNIVDNGSYLAPYDIYNGGVVDLTVHDILNDSLFLDGNNTILQYSNTHQWLHVHDSDSVCDLPTDEFTDTNCLIRVVVFVFDDAVRIERYLLIDISVRMSDHTITNVEYKRGSSLPSNYPTPNFYIVEDGAISTLMITNTCYDPISYSSVTISDKTDNIINTTDTSILKAMQTLKKSVGDGKINLGLTITDNLYVFGPSSLDPEIAWRSAYPNYLFSNFSDVIKGFCNMYPYTFGKPLITNSQHGNIHPNPDSSNIYYSYGTTPSSGYLTGDVLNRVAEVFILKNYLYFDSSDSKIKLNIQRWAYDRLNKHEIMVEGEVILENKYSSVSDILENAIFIDDIESEYVASLPVYTELLLNDTYLPFSGYSLFTLFSSPDGVEVTAEVTTDDSHNGEEASLRPITIGDYACIACYDEDQSKWKVTSAKNDNPQQIKANLSTTKYDSSESYRYGALYGGTPDRVSHTDFGYNDCTIVTKSSPANFIINETNTISKNGDAFYGIFLKAVGADTSSFGVAVSNTPLIYDPLDVETFLSNCIIYKRQIHYTDALTGIFKVPLKPSYIGTSIEFNNTTWTVGNEFTINDNPVSNHNLYIYVFTEQDDSSIVIYGGGFAYKSIES